MSTCDCASCLVRRAAPLAAPERFYVTQRGAIGYLYHIAGDLWTDRRRNAGDCPSAAKARKHRDALGFPADAYPIVRVGPKRERACPPLADFLDVALPLLIPDPPARAATRVAIMIPGSPAATVFQAGREYERAARA